MSTYYYILLLFLCTGTLFTGCQDNNRTIPVDEPDVPTDFSEFYTAFHSDSTFQMNHILFPLDGKPAADTARKFIDDFKWEKEDWKLHNFDHFTPDQFEVHRKVTDSTIVTEIIRDKVSGFGIKRRFAKFNDSWYLIYYDAMNPSN
ncbi:hypothetical protein KUV50_02685 [Membranicola marinus]|uniref:Lipoprotein n=1 Tax=Membranihabitans marinus TaxID=1227546 RepID=A0A953HRF6_9BACT|nr:hypothetical protein [Membranihabitans marinus]MBY5957025.1 hypothetical protein [Membranihabitans marinus]